MSTREERDAADTVLRHTGELEQHINTAVDALARYDAVMSAHILHEDLEEVSRDRCAELRLKVDSLRKQIEEALGETQHLPDILMAIFEEEFDAEFGPMGVEAAP